MLVYQRVNRTRKLQTDSGAESGQIALICIEVARSQTSTVTFAKKGVLKIIRMLVSNLAI